MTNNSVYLTELRDALGRERVKQDIGRATTRQAPIPINQAGAWSTEIINLADLASNNVRLVPRAGYAIVYQRQGSNTGGRLTIDAGTRVENIAPGDVLRGHFLEFSVRASSQSALTGDARLVIITNPEAAFEQALGSNRAVLTPVDLLGSSAAGTYVSQGENALPPTATLAYTGQTANFTLGLTVTGGTSGATGVIVNDVDGGTTGTLHLASVSGTFNASETITDSGGGSATTNGSQVAISGTGLSTFDVTGWSRVSVRIDANSASANATSFDITPWFYDSTLNQWYAATTETFNVPDTALTAQRYRAFILDIRWQGRMFLEIRNLLAAARTSLGFIVQGVE